VARSGKKSDLRTADSRGFCEPHNWNVDTSIKAGPISLLNWIQDELDRILATVKESRDDGLLPPAQAIAAGARVVACDRYLKRLQEVDESDARTKPITRAERITCWRCSRAALLITSATLFAAARSAGPA
jgi:hypothetical protein